MSRHRYVRNMDLDEEMAEDVFSQSDEEEASMSPNYYEDITPTQKAQMISGLEHVRSVVGPGVATDREIREHLWETYFDVDGVVNWWYEKEEKDKAEKERQRGDEDVEKPQSAAGTAPLSALQRLSLARQASAARSGAKPSLSALARKIDAGSKPSTTSVLSSTRTPNSSAGGGGKSPTSLVEKDNAAASQPLALSTPSVQTIPSNKPSLSTLAQKAKLSKLAAPSSTPGLSSAAPSSKPPSKLAQKIKLGQMSKDQIGTTTQPSATTTSSQDAAIEPSSQSSLFVVSPPQSLKRPSSPSKLAALQHQYVLQAREFVPEAIQVAPSPFGAMLAGNTKPIRKLLTASSFSIGIGSKFQFDSPSPDDIVLGKRAGTRLAGVKARGV